ncbi:MAG: dTDP-4-dehydrorhamnose 3,5-epimerase [Pseudomonadota bacterium]
MDILRTPLNDVVVVKTSQTTDARGAFARLFCEESLKPHVQGRRIVQINFSHTRQAGAIRGLHYQTAPYAEMKLIRCIRGKVWDVVVDLRKDSGTFLHWHAEELTPSNGHMLIVPEGFAHGFQVLEPASEMLYLHTAPYMPSAEGGLAYNDPRLAIDWPLPPTDISTADRQRSTIPPDFTGLSL